MCVIFIMRIIAHSISLLPEHLSTRGPTREAGLVMLPLAFHRGRMPLAKARPSHHAVSSAREYARHSVWAPFEARLWRAEGVQQSAHRRPYHMRRIQWV